MRKENGFDVIDRINIYISADKKITDLFKKFEDKIKHNTLAKNVVYNSDEKDYKEIEINKNEVKIKLEKI